jgi:hemerythrin-like metal-binding protein
MTIPLIEWKEEFSIGIPSIDHEHKEMIELINVLYAEVADKDDTEAVSDCLGEIYAKVSAHFALEEKVMLAEGYAEYNEHKADHERLLDDIRDIMDDYEDSDDFNEQDFSERLTLWFVDHFKTKDAKLHKFLNH